IEEHHAPTRRRQVEIETWIEAVGVPPAPPSRRLEQIQERGGTTHAGRERLGARRDHPMLTGRIVPQSWQLAVVSRIAAHLHVNLLNTQHPRLLHLRAPPRGAQPTPTSRMSTRAR